MQIISKGFWFVANALCEGLTRLWIINALCSVDKRDLEG